MAGGEGEISEERRALGRVPMRERAVPSLGTPERLDGRQVATAMRDRMADLHPPVKAADHVIGATPSTGSRERPPRTRIIAKKPQQPTNLARVGRAEATHLPNRKFDQRTAGVKQAQVLRVV
jgi:hypothetical protein